MKKIVLLLLIITLLAACTGTGVVKKSMSEDLNTPEKEALLRERVNEFWSAFVKADYERVYELYDPFFRAKRNVNTFVGMLGRVTYQEFEVQDIFLEGNVATVKMKVVYSLGLVKVKTQEFSVEQATGEFEETWLYIYDNWYKEYRLSSLDFGIAEY